MEWAGARVDFDVLKVREEASAAEVAGPAHPAEPVEKNKPEAPAAESEATTTAEVAGSAPPAEPVEGKKEELLHGAVSAKTHLMVQGVLTLPAHAWAKMYERFEVKGGVLEAVEAKKRDEAAETYLQFLYSCIAPQSQEASVAISRTAQVVEASPE